MYKQYQVRSALVLGRRLNYVGNIELLREKYMGVVGARKMKGNAGTFIETRVREAIRRGFGIVTGGANGCDTCAAWSTMMNGGNLIVVSARPLSDLFREGWYREMMEAGRLLVLRIREMEAPFTRSEAMERNSLIYGLARATLVGCVDPRSNGTWNGAVEALREGRIVGVRSNGERERKLIAMGARELV